MLAPTRGHRGGHIPAGTTCDKCSNPAAFSTVGESDSFGSEYHYTCVECDKVEKERRDFSRSDLGFEEAMQLIVPIVVSCPSYDEIILRRAMRAAWKDDEYHRVTHESDYSQELVDGRYPTKLAWYSSTHEDHLPYEPTEEDKAATDWIVKSLPDYNPGHCEWCRKYSHTRSEKRDWEEGSHGPVYSCCRNCPPQPDFDDDDDY